MSDYPIRIAPHESKWSETFEKLASLVRQGLGENCIEVHHIGSTSVPGLDAKPIIDMIPVVNNITLVDGRNKLMEDLGFEVKGENTFPFRRYFVIKSYPLRCNVHVFEAGNPEIERHVKFRNWIETNDRDRQEYVRLKKELASKYPNELIKYNANKGEFIRSIDEKAGFEGIRIVRPFTNYEWSEYNRIKENQPCNGGSRIDEQNISEDHLHDFILYKGTKIVAISQVELLNENESVIRSLATDPLFKNTGLGKTLLALIEKWIKHQGLRKVKVFVADKCIQDFFLNHNYIETQPNGGGLYTEMEKLLIENKL